MSDTSIPAQEAILATILDEETHPPVDPKVDPPEDPKIEPKIDPEPERQPIGEPGPDPEPKRDPEPNPESEPGSAPPREPDSEVEPSIDAAGPTEPEESFADIFSEFQRTHSRRDGESQIRGTVIAVNAESVFVDIGFKSEGILPLTAFVGAKEPVKPGDGLQVSVKGRDEDGYYQLSLFRTAVPRDWSALERAFADKTAVMGTVTAVVKGGLSVDVGVRAFLPASRSGVRDASELEKLVGQEIRCRITKLDVQDEDVVVDRRVVTEEEALAERSRRYAEVKGGAVVDGTVRSLTDYGAFVDLGGVDGLLHISDVAWTRVANIADVLSVGQQIEVKVLKIDPDGRRISLGLKQLQAHPWDAVAEKYSAGDRVRGVVTRLTDFGAFVEIDPGVEGLVHLSEMSWSKRIHKATEVVKVGDVIDAVILSIGVAERRIGLGLKQALGDPWAEAGARFAVGSIVEGPVASITKFGAFVQVSEGVEGLVHISEIVADRRLNHPSDVLRAGQVVKALVLDVDKEKRQLRLSMKQLIPTGLDEFLAEHAIGDSVTGRVVSIENGAAKIELGDGIVCDCELPREKPAEAAVAAGPETGKVNLSALSSMLKTKWKTGSEVGTKKSTPVAGDLKVGQVREFRISELDRAAKSIKLRFVH